IKHIADLARLELTEEELLKYGEQLSGVLEWVGQLNEVNTENIEPTAQVTGVKNVLREDVVNDWDDDEKRTAIEQAPDFEDGQYRVRRIL
ncbi:MAG: Asp-tRNA(Asn)/Glu-tRNA(Gln) amidotransferase subunit GatC, partial [Synergistales bacterium]|nr:Asp-tRNA(Asn)/Glu-tRNA(Gln) amidotransferase subunit GatC [Synergistales bacterium]